MKTAPDDKKKSSKLNLVDLKYRHAVLKDGLQDFLDDNNLHLSEQNFKRAFQHLLSSTVHYKDLTLYDITNYLQQILEHHEYVIDTMNKTGLAEESLIKLIITADSESQEEQEKERQGITDNVIRPDVKRWKFSIRALPLPVAVSLVLLLSFAVASPFMPSSFYPVPFKTQDAHNEIGASSINELKDLVKRLVELEYAQGNRVSTTKIWNEIKALDVITHHGYKSSYKHFSPAQYREAKVFLEARIAALEAIQH